MSQFGVIKNLINRKEFALKDHHVLSIHQKFKSLCVHRKNLIFTQRKQNNEQRVYNET